jgi:Kef-type K+ transport system membrane component KefB/voltage-gated potassium channel Kch
MELSLFTQIGLVIAVATVIAIIMHRLRQPLILGYILTGIIVGPSVFELIQTEEAKHTFETFAEIGIALLLFIIGLGLNAGVIKGLGKVSLLTAMAVLAIIGPVGFGIATLLGFDSVTSMFIGVALFFSSTIIILKALSDKHELSRLYGQIATGVILIEDIVAIIAILAVTMIATGRGDVAALGWLGIEAIALGAGLYLASRFIIPPLARSLAKSSELLFLFSIGWGLSIASLFDVAGLSHELGALFAGVSLASLPYAAEIASRLKPLRDFFIVLFFVSLGELFTLDKFIDALLPAHLLAAVVMLGKPLVVLSTLGFLGYTKFTSFKAAMHLSQISEFSIILVIFAAASGIVDESAVALVTMVALITIGLSTYMMKYDDWLYKRFENYLTIFERKELREHAKQKSPYPAVLFGYHKGGHEFIEAFREMKLRYLVVDDDPAIIEHLEHQGIRHEFGDMTDEEFLTEINASGAKLVVSTIESLQTNLSTLRFLRRHNPHISFICHAVSYEDAAELYEHGASYVSLPHYIGSERVSNFIKRHGMSHKALSGYRDRHLITIGRRAVKSSQ